MRNHEYEYAHSLLLSKLKEMATTCTFGHRILFTYFLNDRECFVAEQFLSKQKDIGYCFYGGYIHSERQVLCVFSLSVDKSEIDFPICCFEATYPKQFQLGHRDFLGALMSLNLKRELIGDIVILNDEGIAYLFVHKNAQYIVGSELDKVARVGLRLSQINLPELEDPREKTQEKTVVASMRLDCIVGAFSKVSREKASDLIRQGLVFLNYQETEKSSKSVQTGDILTIRGQGKFIIGEISGTSKKGKLHLQYLKYS